MDNLPATSKITRQTTFSSQEKIKRFDQYYADLHHAVYGNILKLVHDSGLAEDLLQDVFLVLWENLEELDPERIPNWVFVVSFNKSISCLKRMRKNRSFSESGELKEPTDIPAIDEEDFERKLQLVYDAVDRLPVRKKEIFKMYRFEGKSINEISSEMKLSINTVKDHLKIAHKTVRSHLFENHLTYSGAELALLIYLVT